MTDIEMNSFENDQSIHNGVNNSRMHFSLNTSFRKQNALNTHPYYKFTRYRVMLYFPLGMSVLEIAAFSVYLFALMEPYSWLFWANFFLFGLHVIITIIDLYTTFVNEEVWWLFTLFLEVLWMGAYFLFNVVIGGPQASIDFLLGRYVKLFFVIENIILIARSSIFYFVSSYPCLLIKVIKGKNEQLFMKFERDSKKKL